MKAEILDFLKSRIGRTIQITSIYGETLVAIPIVVDEEDGYMVCDILSADPPERHERIRRPEASYVIHFEFIESVQELPRGLSS